MRDTRALQMRELAHGLRAIADELLEENVKDPQEMLHIAAIRQLAADAEKRADLIYEPELCGRSNSVGSVCVRPAGHADPHRASHGFSWTDRDDATAAAAIAKTMTGRD